MAAVVSYRHEHPEATVKEAVKAIGISHASFKAFCGTYKEQVKHLRSDPAAAKAFAAFGRNRDRAK